MSWKSILASYLAVIYLQFGSIESQGLTSLKFIESYDQIMSLY